MRNAVRHSFGLGGAVQPGEPAATTDVRWLWFDLRATHRRSRAPLSDANELAQSLPGIEALLAETARSNRRSLALYVGGVAACALLAVAWRALVYGIVFPLNDAGQLSGEAQYRIVYGTVWIPFAPLIAVAWAFANMRQTAHLRRVLSQAYVSLRGMPLAERGRVRAAIPRDSRLAHLLLVNRRWRDLFVRE